jgi:hypothetical protein
MVGSAVGFAQKTRLVRYYREKSPRVWLFNHIPDDPQYQVLFTLGATATPLPAALPLFASGLGGLGFLGWCRKRKATALAA